MKIVLYETQIVLPCFWRSTVNRGQEVSDPKLHGQLYPLLEGLLAIGLPLMARVSAIFCCMDKGEKSYPKRLRVQIFSLPTEDYEQVVIWEGKFVSGESSIQDTPVFFEKFFMEKIHEAKAAALKRIHAFSP